MAEEKKKKSIKETLAELKGMGTSSKSFQETAEKAKQETLAASKNKKLSEPAKAKLKVQKQKEESASADAALKRSRETVNALSTRATLKNYGGYGGPAETEGQVTNAAKPPAKPKPKPKPQAAAAPAPKSQPTASAATPKPKPKPTVKPSSLYISPEAKANMTKPAAESTAPVRSSSQGRGRNRPGNSRTRPKPTPMAKPNFRAYPNTSEGLRDYDAAMAKWRRSQR